MTESITTVGGSWWARMDVQQSRTAFRAQAAAEFPRMTATKGADIVDAMHAANSRERSSRMGGTRPPASVMPRGRA